MPSSPFLACFLKLRHVTLTRFPEIRFGLRHFSGRFIDVNQAFERRYGYSCKELVGRTVFDIDIWDNPGECPHMLDQVREQGRVRNRITRLRMRSGQLLDTIYSADSIELDSQQCILVVPADLPDRASPSS